VSVAGCELGDVDSFALWVELGHRALGQVAAIAGLPLVVNVCEHGTDEPDGAVTDDALRESFERFFAAGREVGRRTVDVVRDDTVNDQVKQAASSLNDALSATAEMIGREVAGWFGRTPVDDSAPTVVGVSEDVPDAARPSTTGLVTDAPDPAPDVDIADVDPGSGTTTPPS